VKRCLLRTIYDVSVQFLAISLRTRCHLQLLQIVSLYVSANEANIFYFLPPIVERPSFTPSLSLSLPHHLSHTMLRSTLILSLLSTLSLASPLALKPDQMVLDGVSWGANKLSSIGVDNAGDIRTMTKWDWSDCGTSSCILSSQGEKVGEGGGITPPFSLYLLKRRS